MSTTDQNQHILDLDLQASQADSNLQVHPGRHQHAVHLDGQQLTEDHPYPLTNVFICLAVVRVRVR